MEKMEAWGNRLEPMRDIGGNGPACGDERGGRGESVALPRPSASVWHLSSLQLGFSVFGGVAVYQCRYVCQCRYRGVGGGPGSTDVGLRLEGGGGGGGGGSRQRPCSLWMYGCLNRGCEALGAWGRSRCLCVYGCVCVCVCVCVDVCVWMLVCVWESV
ncbi:hypothetical protein LZ31DRAFT_35675 [Colletotrichum somersetense]|nr:hypothetical protein LZ31DRAFT_35675 [Colletotrichum somersetense]